MAVVHQNTHGKESHHAAAHTGGSNGHNSSVLHHNNPNSSSSSSAAAGAGAGAASPEHTKQRQSSITSLFRSTSNLNSNSNDSNPHKHQRNNSLNKKMNFNFKNPFKSNNNNTVAENNVVLPQRRQEPPPKLKVNTSLKEPAVVKKADQLEKQPVLTGDFVAAASSGQEIIIDEEEDGEGEGDEDEEESLDEVTELTEEEEDDLVSSSEDSNASSASSVNSQDYEEDEKDYREGGYHPTYIGEIYGPKNNYKIVRKLGWGHFSTVWLLYDLLTDTHVLMKIVRSAKHYTELAIDEVKILTKINTGDENHPGKNHIVRLLDHFSIQGPNGVHICMCFEVLGENMLNLIKKFKTYQKLNKVEEIYGGLPIPLVKHITKQLLLLLDYLHVECGLIHTDIKPENVLIEIKDVEKLLRVIDKNQDGNSKRSVKKSPKNSKILPNAAAARLTQNRPVFHRSRKSVSKINESPIRSSKPLQSPLSTEEIFHRSSVVSTPILEEQIGHLKIKEEDATDEDSAKSEETYDASELIRVKIADLGNACWTDLHYTDDIQTRQYRSPEIILGGDWGCSTDIWSLGCLIFELVTSDYLFDPKNGPNYDKDDDHMAQIIELLEKFPPENFLRLCEYSSKIFSMSSKPLRLKRIKNLKIWTLENVLIEKYHLSPADARDISEFLQLFLQFEPRQRMDAGSLLNHKWLNGYDAGTRMTLPGRKFGTRGEHIPGWDCLVN